MRQHVGRPASSRIVRRGAVLQRERRDHGRIPARLDPTRRSRNQKKTGVPIIIFLLVVMTVLCNQLFTSPVQPFRIRVESLISREKQFLPGEI